MYTQIFSAAGEVDQAFVIIFGFAVFILAFITFLMLWFMWRYHHKRHPKPADIDGNVWAEIIWTVIPFIIVMGLFWTGWTSFKAMRTIPDGAMLVEAEGRMWSWKFTHPNGKKDDILVVPINTPVKLALSAKDVIHSFYVPAMRLKWDMVPGMDTDAWLQSDTLGDFDIFCAEYCGLRHADMITTLRVVTQEEYEAYLSEGMSEQGSEEGPAIDVVALMETQGCLGCHDYNGSMDGDESIAPRLGGIGSTEVKLLLPDGSSATKVRDAAYFRAAILSPSAEIVDGFDDGMYSYEGEMSEEELSAMAAFLVNPEAAPAQAKPPVHPGYVVAEEEGCLSCHSIDGSDEVGPSLKDLFGSTRNVESEAGGIREVVADPLYLRESILNPGSLITEGYYDGMPPYAGDLDDEKVVLLIEWMQSISEHGKN